MYIILKNEIMDGKQLTFMPPQIWGERYYHLLRGISNMRKKHKGNVNKTNFNIV